MHNHGAVCRSVLVAQVRTVMEKAPEAILLLLLFAHSGAVALNASTNPGADEFHVGVILNLGSLVGKETRTSISLAVEDFYAAHRNYTTRLVLHVRDSRGNSFQAASAGTCLALCTLSEKKKCIAFCT